MVVLSVFGIQDPDNDDDDDDDDELNSLSNELSRLLECNMFWTQLSMLCLQTQTGSSPMLRW